MSDSAAVDDWFRDGELQLIRLLVDQRPDLDVASLLPGWSRANIVAHLIGNARGLNNLVTWAATGQETPMYASPEARGAQIAADAKRPAAWLCQQLVESSERLRADYAALTPAQRQVRIRTAQGVDRAAAETAWMRVRESHIHLVDLDIGIGFQDLPPDIADALAVDAAAMISANPSAPAVTLAATDRDARWQVGAAAGATVVTGTAADLLGWLLGRPPRSGSSLSDRPQLPPWL